MFVGQCTHTDTRDVGMFQLVLQPPLPVTNALYRCDKVFHWSHLVPLYKTQVQHGLAILTGDELRCYVVEGSHLRRLADVNLTIHRQNRHKCGGQSQNRYLHQRQNQIDAFIKESAERLNIAYMDLEVTGKPRVASLVLAGTGEVKDMVFAHSSLHAKLRSIIPSVISLANPQEVYKALELARPYFQGADYKIEKATLNRLNQLLADPAFTDTVVYGPCELERAANLALVKELVVHASVVNHFAVVIEMSKQNGATIVTLETLSEEAQMFLDGYGGAMAILFHAVASP